MPVKTKKSQTRTSKSKLTKKAKVPKWAVALGVLVLVGLGAFFVYRSFAVNADKLYIYNHESGNNPAAIYPAADECGLGMWRPCSELRNRCAHWATNRQCQDRFFTDYMSRRYGTWREAKLFWQHHHWW